MNKKRIYLIADHLQRHFYKVIERVKNVTIKKKLNGEFIEFTCVGKTNKDIDVFDQVWNKIKEGIDVCITPFHQMISRPLLGPQIGFESFINS